MITITYGTFNLAVVLAVIAWIISIMISFKLGREVGRDDIVKEHFVSSWHDAGTGRGDDKDGWKCSCGVYGFTPSTAERHLRDIVRLRVANEEARSR